MKKSTLIVDVLYCSQNKPFTWGEIKENCQDLKDSDNVIIYYDEIDNDYTLNATRNVEETDEEYAERLARHAKLSAEFRENRFNKYRELKAEFEKPMPESMVEDFKEFAKKLTSSKGKLVEFLMETGIYDKNGNLTEEYKNG